MKCPSTLLLLPLLAASFPALAADCSPNVIQKLMQDEDARQYDVTECSHSSPAVANDGGLDGVCARNWKSLDASEAKAARCMSDAELAKFSKWRDSYQLHCSMILEFDLRPNYPFDNECRANWDWLKPYDRRQARAADERFQKSLQSVPSLLDHERGRVGNLKECSKYSKAAIEFGAPDGVCNVIYDYLSPAEAKLAPKMAPADLAQFEALRAGYADSCAALKKTLGEAAKSMCGADWSWLANASSGAKMKAAQCSVQDVAKQRP